jgi:hypothetical protein
MSILVILGTNDERGNFCGRLGSITIGSMQFVANDCRGPRVSYIGKGTPRSRLSVFGSRFPYTDHREWVGNWCCDGISMEPAAVCSLLNTYKLLQEFTLESADSDHWDHWHGQQIWTPAQLKELDR